MVLAIDTTRWFRVPEAGHVRSTSRVQSLRDPLHAQGRFLPQPTRRLSFALIPFVPLMQTNFVPPQSFFSLPEFLPLSAFFSNVSEGERFRHPLPERKAHKTARRPPEALPQGSAKTRAGRIIAEASPRPIMAIDRHPMQFRQKRRRGASPNRRKRRKINNCRKINNLPSAHEGVYFTLSEHDANGIRPYRRQTSEAMPFPSVG